MYKFKAVLAFGKPDVLRNRVKFLIKDKREKEIRDAVAQAAEATATREAERGLLGRLLG